MKIVSDADRRRMTDITLLTRSGTSALHDVIACIGKYV
jgi:hypothetical protein